MKLGYIDALDECDWRLEFRNVACFYLVTGGRLMTLHKVFPNSLAGDVERHAIPDDDQDGNLQRTCR